MSVLAGEFDDAGDPLGDRRNDRRRVGLLLKGDHSRGRVALVVEIAGRPFSEHR